MKTTMVPGMGPVRDDAPPTTEPLGECPNCDAYAVWPTRPGEVRCGECGWTKVVDAA